MNRGVLTAFAVLFVVVALAEPEVEVEARKLNKPSRDVQPEESNSGPVEPRPHPQEIGKTKQKRSADPIPARLPRFRIPKGKGRKDKKKPKKPKKPDSQNQHPIRQPRIGTRVFP